MAGRVELNAKELALLARLVTVLEAEPEKPGRFERWKTPASILLGALTITASIFATWLQTDRSTKQFERTMRADQYSDIVDGLASESVGVQVNSLRRLVRYVAIGDNYADGDEQEDAATNAAQTLSAFIEDESTIPGHEGLTDYRDPQPVVVSRALTQLAWLMKNGFPEVDVDLSRANFHGVNVVDIAPTGEFQAVGADFRRATATGWRLDGTDADLSNAFFTCADLQTSDFGRADVAGADFTGANLRGANLREVDHLTSRQLRHALVGDQTRLPDGVARPAEKRAWVVQDGDEFDATPPCQSMVDHMTDLPAGAGYSSRIPCSHASRQPWSVELTGSAEQALAAVCNARDAGSSARAVTPLASAR